MSGMKLRDSIRAPVRYGEGEGAEVPTLRSALRIGLDEVNDDNVELSDSGRSHPQRRRKSTTKPFNPNLPPAAFPTLDRPHANPHIRRIVLKMPQTSTRRHSGTEFPPPAAPASAPQQTRRVTRDPTSLERIHIDDLENHIASNNASNPVFVSNMAMMASAALKDPMDTSEEEENVAMSDNEDLPDQTQVLLDKVSR